MKLSQKISKRVKALDSAFDVGELSPKKLIEAQHELVKESKTLAVFAKDFHNGI